MKTTILNCVANHCAIKQPTNQPTKHGDNFTMTSPEARAGFPLSRECSPATHELRLLLYHDDYHHDDDTNAGDDEDNDDLSDNDDGGGECDNDDDGD